ncbi:MAG: glucokinase [Deltaproteobacteria bacterium]
MEHKKNIILAGDIGGTKTYLGLFARRGHLPLCVRQGKFLNKDYKTFYALLREFIGADSPRIERACLGIASPVRENRCRLTNASWGIDARAISKGFGIKRVELVNDLVALGCGIPLLERKDLYTLKRGRSASGNAAVIAAGTGLGEAILAWDGTTHVPFASEGGHADFAPNGVTQIRLLEYMMKKSAHVSYERVLSGAGLKHIFDFMNQRMRGGRLPKGLKKRFEQGNASIVISSEAMCGADRVCKEAMKAFVSIYGAEAGNLALKAMAVAGVYLGGGIAPGILKALKDKRFGFMDSFVKKGRFEGLLRNLPVYVILNDRAALLGAAGRATGEAKA